MRSGQGWFAWLVLPGIGFLINLYLWLSLDSLALTVGLIWCGLGFVYLLWVTRFFHLPPPDMAHEEAASE